MPAGPFASSVGVGRAEPEWAALNKVTGVCGVGARRGARARDPSNVGRAIVPSLARSIARLPTSRALAFHPSDPTPTPTAPSSRRHARARGSLRGAAAALPRDPLRRSLDVPALGGPPHRRRGTQARSIITPVPIRPRRRGERRSFRTLPGASLRPGSLAFNPRPRRLSTPPLTSMNSTPTSSLRMERPSAARSSRSDAAPSSG